MYALGLTIVYAGFPGGGGAVAAGGIDRGGCAAGNSSGLLAVYTVDQSTGALERAYTYLGNAGSSSWLLPMEFPDDGYNAAGARLYRRRRRRR